MNKGFALEISADVKEALARGQAVVALESTIITHGMPYPQNVEMARQVEQDVRDGGAVPATIALLDGAIKIGLESADLDRLGQMGGSAAKASRRDVAYLVATGKTAGTTVATTMQFAHAAGIRFFATGGIGGVHRGADQSFDISADLMELGRTPVCVVCAGAKSILDIAKTLEVLETQGVPVLGFGTPDFPAFYLRKSGFGVDAEIGSAAEGAQVLSVQWRAGMGGVLMANPIRPEDEPDADVAQAWIDGALAAADEEVVQGKDITPFLLGKIFELSGGESLIANIALVRNNARVAAELAAAYAKSQKSA